MEPPIPVDSYDKRVTDSLHIGAKGSANRKAMMELEALGIFKLRVKRLRALLRRPDRQPFATQPRSLAHWGRLLPNHPNYTSTSPYHPWQTLVGTIPPRADNPKQSTLNPKQSTLDYISGCVPGQ